ncbi:hypothetical protein V1478_003876 [Vespula squamosa]|uniref:Transposase n=1 Tax=Vespula squamosa TaxID=30214 RepID=A0ABD2BPF6_VESSQ
MAAKSSRDNYDRRKTSSKPITGRSKRKRQTRNGAERKRPEQSRAEQNRTEQNRTEQNRTEQNRARREQYTKPGHKIKIVDRPSLGEKSSFGFGQRHAELGILTMQTEKFVPANLDGLFN